MGLENTFANLLGAGLLTEQMAELLMENPDENTPCMDIKTWDDILSLTKHDPVIGQCVMLIEKEMVTREQGLITCVIALHNINENLKEMAMGELGYSNVRTAIKD